ncbi:hypothetical protein AVEN_175421-1 [Araneus ventricosus]|uniref:Uncharacterized protein n=1 Tax=Araneus ventricosus TaxID=182803 RepID=A0A4Y2MW10_ARAVE|nr:hypothetical protein AVEN_175421-1 [Araneus ventricosus]
MGRHARPTRGVLAVQEKQETNSVTTASHGELPRLPSRDGIKQRKAEGKGEGKLEGSKDPWEPRDWDTRTHLKQPEPIRSDSPPGTLTILNAKAQRVNLSLVIPFSRPEKRPGYRPIDTPETEIYHPSSGLPRTTNTWGYFAVHEKQAANRVATASHGELPRLPSREGKKTQKLKGRGKTKGDKTLGYLGVVNPGTSEDVPLRGVMEQSMQNEQDI